MLAQTIIPLEDQLRLGPEEGRLPEHQVGHLAGRSSRGRRRSPAAKVGLIVTLATNRRTRLLSLPEFASSGSGPRVFFMMSAVCMARSPVLAHATHRLGVATDDGDRTHVVQDALGDDRLAADPALGEGDVRGDLRSQISDQTIIISKSSDTELTPQGSVGLVESRQDVGLADDLEKVGSVAAAGPSLWYVWMSCGRRTRRSCPRRIRLRSGCRCGWRRRRRNHRRLGGDARIFEGVVP